MSKFLSQRTIVPNQGDSVFVHGDIARKARQKDSAVINASVGMYYDEDLRILAFDTVKEVLSKLTKEQKYPYAPIDGTTDFKKGLINWLFRKTTPSIPYTVFPTPGSSAVISNCFNLFLDENEEVICGHLYWEAYTAMAKANNVTITTFPLFENDHFNLLSFKETVLKVSLKQKRLFIMINDPAHNPTGYALSDQEWEDILAFLKTMSQTHQIIIFYDMAYIDYSSLHIDDTRKHIYQLAQLGNNFLTVLAFSASKTLSMYGYRLGASVILSQDQDAIVAFEKASSYLSRGRFSSSNLEVQSAIGIIFNDPNYYQAITLEIEAKAALLRQRASIFLNEAKEVGLQHFPYVAGFFILIKTNKVYQLHEELIRQKVYGIPMDGSLRIALCSINLNQVKGLAQKIMEAKITIGDTNE